jgi:hypothetical protein
MRMRLNKTVSCRSVCHVMEEQNEMFPKAQKTRLDMVSLRDEMMAKKEALLAQSAA